MVYVARLYVDGVRITERRNLVYHMRNLVKRSECGIVLAGMSACISPYYAKSYFNIFY